MSIASEFNTETSPTVKNTTVSLLSPFPIAATLSYLKWHGFWLAFFHGLMGWYYIIYFINAYIYHFVK